MRKSLIFCAFMMCLSFFGQNNFADKGTNNHIKLEKSNEVFSCIYSDINDKYSKSVKSFQIPDLTRVYSIIMTGFEKKRNHKMYVKTNDNTIVRLDFSKMNGVIQLRINHNNLVNNYIGSTTFLDRRQVVALFKNFIQI